MCKKSIRKLFFSALFFSLLLPSVAQAADPLKPGQVTITRVVQSVGSISVYWAITGPGAAATGLEYDIDDPVNTLLTVDSPSLVSPLVITKDPLDTNLDSTVLYTVVLRGKNAAGSGPSSATLNVKPNGVQTSPPRITSIVSGDQSVAVGFARSDSGLTDVQYSTDNGTSWSPAYVVDASASTITISSLSSDQSQPLVNGTRYSIRLRSLNISSTGTFTGTTGMSAAAIGTPSTIPSSPEITSVDARGVSIVVNAELGLTGGASITGLDYSTDNGASWAGILPVPAALSGKLNIPGTPFSFTITTQSSGSALVSGATYSVKVRTSNLIGDGPASTEVATATIGSQSISPPSIESVTARNSSLVVKSTLPTMPSGVSLSIVEFSTDNGASWRTTAQKTGSFVIAVTSTNTTLTPGRLYSVRVRVITSVGAGAQSGVYEVSVGNASAPPVLLSATSNSGAIAFAGALGNTNGAPVIRLEYSTDNGASWATGMTPDDVVTSSPSTSPTTTAPASSSTTTAPTTTTTVAPAATASASIPKTWSFAVSSLSSNIQSPVVPGAAYTVRVRAVSAAGTSAPSNSKVVTLAGSPKVPVILSATAGNNSVTLTISYTKPTGVVVSDIEYSTDDGASWASSGDTGNTLVITEESSGSRSYLNPGENYAIRIRIIANGGVSATSAPKSVRTTGTDSAVSMEKINDKLLSVGTFSVKGIAKTKSSRALTYSSSTTDVCKVSGVTVTLVKAGVCTILASVTADGEFKKDSVSRNFNVLELKVAALAVGEDMSVKDLALLQFPAKAPNAKMSSVSVVSAKGICTLKNATVLAVKKGACKVKMVSKNKAGKTVTKVALLTIK